MARGWNVPRLIVVALLGWGAYWAALPWIICFRAFPGGAVSEALRFCTFGFGIPGFPPAQGWNLLVGALYVAAAIWTAARRP